MAHIVLGEYAPKSQSSYFGPYSQSSRTRSPAHGLRPLAGTTSCDTQDKYFNGLHKVVRWLMKYETCFLKVTARVFD